VDGGAPRGPHGQPLTDERITRNWNELLQELRVTQTGAQILSGFLLTVPFSNRFEDLADGQRAAYLVVLCGATLTTALLVAPVAFHRVLFRQRMRPWLVEVSNACAKAGLLCLALTSSGCVFLVFDVVTTRTAALAALLVAIAVFGGLWWAFARLASPAGRP